MGESPRLLDLALFFLADVVGDLPLARRVAAVARDPPADLLAARFDSAGPFADDRPLADFALRVDDRAVALVPARAVLVLLRDLEDFFARAAMTVSSPE